MLEVLLAIIDKLNSSVVVLILILIAVGVMLFRGGRLVQKFQHHDDQLSQVKDIHKTVIELKTKVDLIYTNTNPRPLVSAHSPLALTDLGKQLAQAINAETIFSRNEEQLIAALNTKCAQDANAYDIQVAALDIAKLDFPGLLTAEELNIFKKAAFDNGILLEDIWAIFGIYLRDKVFEQRGISALEVDRHDPALHHERE